MLGEWVAEAVEGRAAEQQEGAAGLDAARRRLTEAAGQLDDPVLLSDRAIGLLLACEGAAVAAATAPPTGTTWEMFRGRALDAFVEHVLFAGPVGDPAGDLEAMYLATESTEDLALLESHLGTPGAVADLAELAAGALAFSELRRWDARVQVTMAVELRAAGSTAAVLRGRPDVVLGGPGTPHPAVLIEVKSGLLREAHRAQLRHYVMLAALRNGAVPAAAALWSPVAGLEPMHVPGVVASAAERCAAALQKLAPLLTGTAPVLSPGLHCRFCVVADRCPAAHSFDPEARWSDQEEEPWL